MPVSNFFAILIVGGIAGWIAGNVMKGRGFGIFGNIMVGIVGAFFGGFLFRILGLSAHGVIGSLIMATLGAIALLAIIGYLRKV
jgi:uncharacterized membrane protein YeaQ/YmgE (transglycosylase-associated protein family)